MKEIFRKTIKEGLLISLVAVVIAVVISIFSETIIEETGSIILMIFVLFIIIVFGIIADATGTAAAAATLQPLNALASKKVIGAREAVSVVKRADKVANICQDVIGDVLNTLSGVFGVAIAILITQIESLQNKYTLFITAGIVALTVFGKALGKSYAIKEANSIILVIGKIIYYFKKVLGR